MTSSLRLFLRLQKLFLLSYNGTPKLKLLEKTFPRSTINSFSFSVVPFPVPDYFNLKCSSFSSTTLKDATKTQEEKEKEKKKPKTVAEPKIVLLSETGGMTVVTLEEANKIAKKKSVHLKEVDNRTGKVKTDKKVYQLFTNAQMVDDDKWKSKGSENEKDKAKDSKTLILRSTTSDNDIMSKVKNIKKWIEKGHTVRVYIGKVGEKGNSEHVYDVMQNGLKDITARIVQKVVKGSEIRFQVMPPKELKKKSNAKKIDTDNNDEDDDDENNAIKTS